ncbi:hypothetical protein C8A00DRAFT_37566 [Chaetomidium leptoderma]|uniref:Uncharacterized protein n=1 Tax=Chaetomidium leptoderma TaxID=669021 RepID=A0AAN6VFD0_9PEZI|nr:hypothetical protein C8A00DRAFT_37566 [Chaetomidium leptoderma]
MTYSDLTKGGYIPSTLKIILISICIFIIELVLEYYSPPNFKMLANILILAATSLATIAHSAVLPGTKTGNAITALRPILADAAATPNVSARAVINPAVQWTEHENRDCGGWKKYYEAGDDGCYLLPTGDGFDIDHIANTCRVFIYESKSCNGAEFQAYPGNCYDVHAFYSIKTFCN